MPRLFVHGWGADARVWPVSFADAHSVMYNPAGTFPDYSHLTHVFLSLWQKFQQPVTLVGWSLGGMLTLRLASEYPEKIHKVVLVSSTVRFTNCAGYTAGLHPAIVTNLARKMLRNQWKTQSDFYQMMFSDQEKEWACNFLTAMAPAFKNIPLSVLQDGLAYLLSEDLRELLPQINAPCYILHGGDDVICPVESAYFLANHLKKSKLYVLKNTGHIPFFTRPADVAKFLSQEDLAHD